MSGRNKNLRGAVCAIALASVLAGCGGGDGGTASAGSSNTGSGNSPPAGNTLPAEIQGVDTPSSVSVVTATNAN